MRQYGYILNPGDWPQELHKVQGIDSFTGLVVVSPVSNQEEKKYIYEEDFWLVAEIN
jgi:hypothetical protein